MNGASVQSERATPQVMPRSVEQILPGLFRIPDTCNVYVVAGRESSIAIDFGSGRWLPRLPELGLPPLAHLFLTHHHADQCSGLLELRTRRFCVHAGVHEEPNLSPAGVRDYWRTRRDGGCPRSYCVLRRGVRAICYDMAGFGDLFWERRRIRFLDTPGHGPGAVSVLLDHAGKQVVFCGDAAFAQATIWQPYHLEWDHWTGSGALAAWEGVQRLKAIGMKMLCPAHGPVIAQRPRAMLNALGHKLVKLYEAKGSICPGQPDRYVEPMAIRHGARQILPDLYQFATNAYLLLGEGNEALAIDVQASEMDVLERLRIALGRPVISAALATHYHLDHSDGLPPIRRRYGSTIHLHPSVARPLRRIGALDVPWLPRRPIIADRQLPFRGPWRWNRYRFRVAHFPGQTWWHCGLMTAIAGRKVFFGGDTFQPNSRWNGTGGFCAFNGCRFQAGFARSARLLVRWCPDILANGHGTCFKFHASQFHKIIRWSQKAEMAVKTLCPTGSLEKDYYLHRAETGGRRASRS